MTPASLKDRLERAKQQDFTDEDLERELEGRIAARPGLDEPAYPYRGVYFIRCAGFIKIGIADSVITRLAEFRRIIPVPITPIGWVPCRGSRADVLALERTLHQRFAATRTTGEWLTPSPEIQAYCATPNTVEAWPV